jgi:hypothetical protein
MNASPPLRRRPLIRGARLTSLALVAAALALPVFTAAAGAQESLRSTFPGRRLGGGTRGECASRLLAHLVPVSSVYAPAATPTLGLLEGPSPSPRPLQIEFRPQRGAVEPLRRTLPPAPVGVTLVTLPAIRNATVWESSYQCETGGAGGASDPLAFVASVAPPALSLLVTDRTPADLAVQAGLENLRRSCGKEVATAEVAAAFGLADVVTPSWPSRIPVRCL